MGISAAARSANYLLFMCAVCIWKVNLIYGTHRLASQRAHAIKLVFSGLDLEKRVHNLFEQMKQVSLSLCPSACLPSAYLSLTYSISRTATFSQTNYDSLSQRN